MFYLTLKRPFTMWKLLKIDKSEPAFILKSMKIGERGQVTIPKEFRSRFGLAPATEVKFIEENGQLILKKSGPAVPAIRKFTGILKGGGLRSDDVVESMRGR